MIAQFALTDETTVKVPTGSKRLGLGVVKETPTIWFDTTSSKSTKTYTFRLAQTGDQTEGEYVGTCVLYGGDSVVHVFSI